MLPKHPDLMSDEELRSWVAHLVDDLVEEGPRLDYKEIQNLDTPTERREVAKDLSSFANEVGGTVLYGIPEDRTADGPPIPRKPYGITPIPSFETRVDNILVDSIRPTLPEWKIRTVSISSRPRKVVYLVWTPESWVGAHMVEAYVDRRYYRRGQYRAVAMTESEVRDRYERILAVRNWADQFLQSQELNYVAARLPDVYRSHYVVCPVIASENRIDFTSEPIRRWIGANPYPYLPWTYRPSAYGIRSNLVIRYDQQEWDPYNEIYRNGAISHWTPTAVSQPENALAYIAELDNIDRFLKYTSALYSLISYTGPIRVVVHISHTKSSAMDDLKFPRPLRSPHEWPRLLTHDNSLRVDIQESAMTLMNSPRKVLKAVADEMFRAYGFWEADCFDENLNFVRS